MYSYNYINIIKIKLTDKYFNQNKLLILYHKDFSINFNFYFFFKKIINSKFIKIKRVKRNKFSIKFRKKLLPILKDFSLIFN